MVGSFLLSFVGPVISHVLCINIQDTEVNKIFFVFFFIFFFLWFAPHFFYNSDKTSLLFALETALNTAISVVVLSLQLPQGISCR